MIITCLVLGSLLILSFLVYASYSIRSEIYLRSFCRKRTGEKVIALTFDDGPDPICRFLKAGNSRQYLCLFPLYRLSRMKKDLQTCQSELERVTSQPVTLFRPPFGVTNPTIAKAVRQLGYTSIGWNIRTLDTQQPSPEKVLDRIRKGLKPGSIILLHDRMPNSGQLVKQILDLLKKQGYTIVRLDELLA